MTIKATFVPNVHLGKQLQSAYDEGAKQVAEEVIKEARRTVPVDTGFLKRTHYIRRLGAGRLGRYRVGATALYAKYVHDGTSRQAAQPWLQRAIDQVKGPRDPHCREGHPGPAPAGIERPRGGRRDGDRNGNYRRNGEGSLCHDGNLRADLPHVGERWPPLDAGQERG